MKKAAFSFILYTGILIHAEGSSAVELGDSYIYGTNGKKQNVKKALAEYKKACNDGDLTGCSLTGELYLDKEELGNESDAKTAVKYLVKPCEEDIPEACHVLSKAYRDIGEVELSHNALLKACQLTDSIAWCNEIDWE